MPRRHLAFVTGEFYHLYSRSLYRQPIFTRKRDLDFFTAAMEYYLMAKPPTKFSYFRRSPGAYKVDYKEKLVTLISYCIMPNHLHLCVRQEKDNGIQTYMQKLLSSYSHYYRTKNTTSGPFFPSAFKAVHIETDDQLLHLSRYHHLNPVTAGLVKHPKEYMYSSYGIYMGALKKPDEKAEIYDPSYVLSHFKSAGDYEKFVLDRADYQKELAEIKHLMLHRQADFIP